MQQTLGTACLGVALEAQYVSFTVKGSGVTTYPEPIGGTGWGATAG